MPKDEGIGASPKRREDIRFLTGTGQYTDDFNLTGQAYAVFARSTVANGRIRAVDTGAAAAMPGVLAVFTGEDFADVGGNPAGWYIESRDGTPMREPKRPVLAHGKVRHVGDAYAAVVAETQEQAEAAAEAIEAIAHGDEKSSKVVGKAIGDIDLPEGTTIGAVVRKDQVLIAHDDVVVESDDHVVLFLVDKRRIQDVERLFQVGITFF